MRNADWPQALVAYISARMRKPFSWDGTGDCAAFVADAGIAMGADDLLKGLRGYKSARGALGRLKRKGFANLEALCRSRLEECPRSQARRGDVALIISGDDFGGSLALVDGATIVGPGERVLQRLPLASAHLTFRLG